MTRGSVSPALYALVASFVLLAIGIALDPKTTGAMVGYAYGTLFEPISLIAALAIGAFVPRALIALLAGVAAAVAIHFIVLSIDPGVAQLRRVSGETISDTFVLLARAWGMVVAVSIVALAAAGVKRLRSSPAGAGNAPGSDNQSGSH